MGMIADLFVKLGFKGEEFNRGIDNAKAKTTTFGNAMGKIGSVVAGAFAIGTITNFISSIISVRSEFAKYEAVLTNALGSSQAARREMAMLQEFAAQTPFALSTVTDGFVKLVNYGLKPTKEELTSYGDLASSVGKDFNQLVEALADATTGQFERLKEFGIKASQEGSKVSFVFKGQATVVENSANAIKSYIQSLGQAQGVSGAMAAISETLGGKISNLGDNWDKLLNTLGKQSDGVFASVTGWLANFISDLEIASKSVADLKTEVMDKSVSDGMKNALKEIDDMTTSLVKNGMTQAKAHANAIELYNKSIDSAVQENMVALTTSGGKRQQVLDKNIELMLQEQSAVKEHFDQLGKVSTDKTKKQLEEESKEAQAILDKKKKAFEDQSALYKSNSQKQEADAITRYQKGEINQGMADDLALRSQLEFYEKQKLAALKFGQETGQIDLDIAIQKAKIKESVPELMKPKVPIAVSKEDKSGNLITEGSVVKAEISTEEEKKQLDKVSGFISDMNGLIEGGMEDVAGTFAEGIGGLMSGDMNIGEFGASILASIGSFLVKMGQMLIAYAISMEAFKNAFSNPLVALAAGIALVAIGGMVSSMAKKGMDSAGGGGATGGSAGQGSGASGYSPMSGASSAATAMGGSVSFQIQGSSLVGVLANNDKKNSNYK